MSGDDNLERAPAPPREGEPDGAAPVGASSGDDDETQRTRREASARREVNETVVFRQGDRVIEGWALNVSRGGLRAIIDEALAVGEEMEMSLGEGSAPRPVRVVWTHREKGGSIVGVSFLDISGGSIPPPPSAAPPPSHPPNAEGSGDAAAAAARDERG